MKEGYTFNPKPWVYDMDAGHFLENHYFQNEPEKWYNGRLGLNGVAVSSAGVITGSYTNRIPTLCSTFVASMLHQAFGVDILAPGTSIRNVDFCTAEFGFFNKLGDDEVLQPGDVLRDGTHAQLYLGCDPVTGRHRYAHTNGTTNVIGYYDMYQLGAAYVNKPVTVGVVRRVGAANGKHWGGVYRLKPELLDPNWQPPEEVKIYWPNGSLTTWSGDLIQTGVDYQGGGSGGSGSGTSSVGDKYEGIAESIGPLGITHIDIFGKIWKGFNELIDYFIGLITMAIRIPFVGIARTAEWAVSSVVEVITNKATDSTLTLEKIVYNQIPLFDINVFNTTEGEHEIIQLLRSNIAGWYFAFRNLVLAILLVVLIYLGIRMAITSVAEEKAQYKRMLVDWFISFFMVLFIHYFLVIVLEVNDILVKMLYNYVQSQVGEAGSIYELVSEKAHAIKFTEGWYGAILYIALVWYMIKYAWKYIKRLLSAFILIILSPFVAVSYALDKIKDNRSQSLSKWLKEIIFTVLIQAVHALIYTVFLVGIVMKITSASDILQAIGACIFLIIAVRFMEAAENVFETIFGFNSSSALKEIMSSTFEAFAKFKIAKDFVVGYTKLLGKGAKLGGKVIGIVGGATIKFGNKYIPGMQNVTNRVNVKINQWKNSYYEELEGIPRDDNPTLTKIGSIIEQERNKQKTLLTKGRAKAKKMFTTAKNFAKQSVLGTLTFIENPQAAIAHLVAAGTSIATIIKMIKPYRNIRFRRPNGTFKGKFTSRKEYKQKMKLLGEVRDNDIALRKIIDEVYGDTESILARGNRPDASAEERRQAKYIERVLNMRYHQASMIVGQDKVGKAIRSIVLKGDAQDRMETLDGAVDTMLVGIANDNPEIKINRMQTHNHFREELEKAMRNKVLNEQESTKITFGKELDDKIREIRTNIIGDITIPEEEKKQQIEREIETTISDYYRQEEHKEELDQLVQRMSVEDLTHIMTRALNREGSIDRGYQYQFEPTVYSNVVQQTMQQQEPTSYQDLEQFTKKVEENLPEEQRRVIGPTLGENVRQELEELQNAVSGRQAVQDVLSDERIKQIREEIDREGVSQEKVTQAVFEKLTTDEKTSLFTSAMKVESTPELDEELRKYDRIIEQATKLRESYIESLDRIKMNVPDIVEDIRKGTRRKNS